MEKRQELTSVISGSFKFKPEIDAAHEEFRDHDVIVLAPDQGWLYLPRHRLQIFNPDRQFRPLPTEQDMSIREIEDTFLQHLRSADLVYLFNFGGYVGNSMAFELGFAIALQKPVYALEPLAFEEMEVDDIATRQLLRETVRVMPISDVPKDYTENQ